MHFLYFGLIGSVSKCSSEMFINHPCVILLKMIILHSADERFDATFHTNVLVNSSGACQYLPPGTFQMFMMPQVIFPLYLEKKRFILQEEDCYESLF